LKDVKSGCFERPGVVGSCVGGVVTGTKSPKGVIEGVITGAERPASAWRHHSDASPLLAEYAPPENEYRSTMRSVPS
jgi:hypothetical protein